MTIDHAAKAMTAGRPRAGFTPRVMAVIEGRPAPGFTDRVMRRIDDPEARGIGIRALILVPAAIALAVAVVAWRIGQPVAPIAPEAPRVAAAPYDRAAIGAPPLPPDRWIRTEAPIRIARRDAQQDVPAAAALPEPAPIYVIDALEKPPDIAMKSIEPAACTIPALDDPAPLKITDLKEKS